jgi:hypothetical protein
MYKHMYISLQFSDMDFSFAHVNLNVQWIATVEIGPLFNIY